MIYLDNNATTRIAPEVRDEILPYLDGDYGNPSSIYDLGRKSRKAVENARSQIGRLLNCAPEEIIFTSCGTESDNAAIWGLIWANPGKKHIITSTVEHHAIGHLCEFLKKQGFDITEIDVDENGILDTDQLKKSIRPDTLLVTVMHSNNETGIISPVDQIAKICWDKNIYFHTDAVQSVGKIPIDLNQIPIDLLSLSGHKLHAPKGVGALYIRKGTDWHPFVQGGPQEDKHRGGTENVLGIVALGKAAELTHHNMPDEIKQISTLRDKFEKIITEKIPGIRITGKKSPRLPNTSHLTIKDIEDYKVILKLNESGICASSGSACNQIARDVSHVLKALHIPDDYIHGSLRISLSRFTTEQEIDYLLDQLPDIIQSCRKKSN